MKKIFLISLGLATSKYFIQFFKESLEIQFVGLSSSLKRTAVSIQRNPPDIILVDLDGLDLSEVQHLEKVRGLNPAIKVLLLAASETDDNIFHAIRAGANGCILKGSPPDDIRRAIQVVHNGDFLFTTPVATKLVAHFQSKQSNLHRKKLSLREVEAIGLLSKGYRYKEIAEKMGISVETVRTYSKRIFSKLEVRSRLHAVIKYQS